MRTISKELRDIDMSKFTIILECLGGTYTEQIIAQDINQAAVVWTVSYTHLDVYKRQILNYRPRPLQ